ncbi:MAG: hypothetical protein M3N57_01740 [Actinomycetota bacterium]|nr:hypothetical protein [Actinomycetota bacterium]
MTRTTTTDRKASAEEVRKHAKALRALAAELGVDPVRVRDDGTVVVHADEPGYRQALEASARASALVGTYVHVITDDVPGAVDAQEL